jgi:hypothetical protein
MSMVTRSTRDQEVRASDERIDYAPPDQLPVPQAEPGWSFRWVATHVLGDANGRNVSQRFREGWVPVRAEDYPELLHLKDKDGNVEVGGLMLCKNAEEKVVARRRYYANKSAQQMSSVDEQYMSQNSALMPKFSKVKTSVTKGRGFGNGS